MSYLNLEKCNYDDFDDDDDLLMKLVHLLSYYFHSYSEQQYR